MSELPLLSILIVTGINCLAVKVSGGVATVLSGVKIALVLFVGIGAFLFARSADWSHLFMSNAGGTCEGVGAAVRVVGGERGVGLARTVAQAQLEDAEHLRASLRGRPLARQLDHIEAMTTSADATIEHRITTLTLRSITARIRFLAAQLAELDPELTQLVRQHPAGPALLAEPGVGPVVAAQMLISWSHPGRVRDEAAFACLAGVAPLEASSGQQTRHRLNRGGDRALNRALHTVAITRMRCHPETRAYQARRTAQGKTHRDIRRCIKRAIARRLYRIMESAARQSTT